MVCSLRYTSVIGDRLSWSFDVRCTLVASEVEPDEVIDNVVPGEPSGGGVDMLVPGGSTRTLRGCCSVLNEAGLPYVAYAVYGAPGMGAPLLDCGSGCIACCPMVPYCTGPAFCPVPITYPVAMVGPASIALVS